MKCFKCCCYFVFTDQLLTIFPESFILKLWRTNFKRWVGFFQKYTRELLSGGAYRKTLVVWGQLEPTMRHLHWGTYMRYLHWGTYMRYLHWGTYIEAPTWGTHIEVLWGILNLHRGEFALQRHLLDAPTVPRYLPTLLHWQIVPIFWTFCSDWTMACWTDRPIEMGTFLLKDKTSVKDNKT